MPDEYEDIGEAYEELSKINETQQKEIERLCDLATDFAFEAVGHPDKNGVYDSCANSGIVDAMEFLIEMGHMVAVGQPKGRRMFTKLNHSRRDQ